MQSFEPVSAADADTEYRAIEAALLETARGRWFLAEHSRRSRRIETIELEDALARLKSSLREPPALLGRLKVELSAVEAMLGETRAELMARPRETGGQPSTGAVDPRPTSSLLEAAERLHEMIWSLQARDVDPATCEAIGRQTTAIFALTARQAQESQRVLKLAAALDTIADRVAAVMQSIVLEADDDDGEPAARPAAEKGRAA